MATPAEELRKLNGHPVYSQHYNFHSLLGEGSFCRVYKATDCATQEEIAVKIIKRKQLGDDDVDLLRSESEILQSLSHENIVRFKHVGFCSPSDFADKRGGRQDLPRHGADVAWPTKLLDGPAQSRGPHLQRQ